MSSIHQSSPLVSVVTPVYNGGKYLRACIDSVLAQSYANWDYTIVDNRSTDGSLAIAREYADADPRIRVQPNDRFVGVIENHNRAFRATSIQAKYCKLLSADDWMYPECIARLVDVAERHPSVGLVGSYAVRTTGVPWGFLPLDTDYLQGHEAIRRYLLGEIDHFSVPSTALYRASLVRAADAFFPGSSPSADLEAALGCLRESDLGIVHQVLSFERIHDESINVTVRALGTNILDRLRVLMKFGPEFLSPDDFQRRRDEQLSNYYADLAVGCFNLRGREYWKAHKAGLDELGCSLSDPRFARAILAKGLDLTLNPKATVERLARRVKTNPRAFRAARRSWRTRTITR